MLDYNPTMSVLKLKDNDPLPTVGFELEFEGRSHCDDEAPSGIGWFKDDGSLCDDTGIEFCTYPMTLPYYNKLGKKLIQEELDRHPDRVISDRCGLHIHVGKAAFKPKQFTTLLDFSHNNQAFMYKLSGRTSKLAMNRYASPKYQLETNSGRASRSKRRIEGARQELENGGLDYFGKYHAIYFGQRNTVEFRLFKGVKDVAELEKRLAIVLALIDYTKKPNKLTADEFKTWVLNHRKGVAQCV